MWALLIPIIAFRLVLDLPRMAANKAGFGFKSKFALGNLVIERPAHFKSKEHKAAFENVGNYVTDPLKRDVMLVFQDRDLEKDSILHPSGIPLAVWHEVLECFAKAGMIEVRWELRIPSVFDGKLRFDRLYEHSHTIPWWTADGKTIEGLKEVRWEKSGPYKYEFFPNALTNEQKAALLGKEYRIEPNDTKHGHWPSDKAPEQEYVTLGEENFERMYFRSCKLFSEKQIEKGAEKMAWFLRLASIAQNR